MPDGIDVSHYQQINWDDVPGDLIFVAAKATEGSKYTDPTFARNWASMRARGFQTRVAYHFLQAGNAADQAKRFADVVGPLGAGETLALDWEQPGTTPDQAVVFLTTLDALLPSGHQPILYVGEYFPGSHDARLAGRPLWVPQYRQTLHTTRPVMIWQNSSSGVVPGVRGRVDVNVVLNKLQLAVVCGLIPANAPIPQPPPPPPPADAGDRPLPQHATSILGAQNDDVRKAQYILKYLTGKPANIDGHFDQATLSAVTDFQKFFGVWDPQRPGVPTGQLDQHTWDTMNLLVISKGWKPS